MAESGCLKTEKYNSMNINDRIISKSFNGGRLEIKSKSKVSLSDFSKEVKDIPDDTDSEYIIHDGAFLTLTNNQNSSLISTTDTFETTATVPWPNGSYIQDLSIIFKNTVNPQSSINFGDNTMQIKLNAVDSSDSSLGLIMDYKKIGLPGVGHGLGKVFKNIPIPIIKCCTGIHSQSLKHCPAFLIQSNTQCENFNIIDPDDTEGWIYNAASNGGNTSLARCYPLYNPQDGDARPDKLQLTLQLINNAGDDNPSGLGNILEHTELLIIVTYMKMNLKDIAF